MTRIIAIGAKTGERREAGVIGLLTVVVLGAFILTIGLSAAYIGQSQIVAGGGADGEQYVRELAAACVDEAVYRLKLDSAYAGGALPLDVDSCTVTVTGTGSGRTIAASASAGGYSKSFTIEVSLRQNPSLTAAAWHVDGWAENNP